MRHERATCPRCSTSVKVRTRTKYWVGENARKAQEAAAKIRSDGQPVLFEEKMPKHDSPASAAAAKARVVRNASQKAEIVMVTLTQLLGDVPEKEALIAMRDAGLTSERAEKELIRMLACDEVFEPRLGFYRSLSS